MKEGIRPLCEDLDPFLSFSFLGDFFFSLKRKSRIEKGYSNFSSSSTVSENTFRAFFTVSGFVRSTPAIFSSFNG